MNGRETSVVSAERLFPECWDCDRPQAGPLDDEWPLCDDCVLSHPPGYRWCCAEPVLAFGWSRCEFNAAYVGRRERVVMRRALPRSAGLLEAGGGSMNEHVFTLLSRARFTSTDEESLQRGVAAVLDGLGFVREYQLTKRDRPDFFNPETGTVVEIKRGPSGGSLTKVVGQVARYAEHERVQVIIVATTSRRLAGAFPTAINGRLVSAVVLNGWM